MTELTHRLLSRLDQETEGQGLVEYGLILIFVSIVSAAALTILGGQLSSMFSTVTGAF